MTLDLWALAMLLSKLIAYISFASLAGAYFVIWLNVTQSAEKITGGVSHLPSATASEQRLCPFLVLNSAAGLACVLLFFLLQVGLVNQNGLSGMMDWFMITLLMQTEIGMGVGLKAAGFLVLGLVGLALAHRVKHRKPIVITNVMRVLILLGVGLLCAGFAAVGHVVSLGLFEQFVLALHVLAIALWVGAFYPLYLLCQAEQAQQVYPLMKRFGDWGWVITLSLSIAGGYLLTQLLSSPWELVSTAYGGLMLLKVLCVLCLLGLAALNKFRLVPALAAAGAQPLARSIKAEMCLAALILLLTATLSTVTGPAHLMG